MYTETMRATRSSPPEYEPFIHFEGAQTSILVLDKCGLLRYINPAWQQWAGLDTSNGACIGHHYGTILASLFDPDSSFIYAIAHGLRLVLYRETTSVEVQYPDRSNGAWTWLHLDICAYPMRDGCGVLVAQRVLTDRLLERAVGQ